MRTLIRVLLALALVATVPTPPAHAANHHGFARPTLVDLHALAGGAGKRPLTSELLKKVAESSGVAIHVFSPLSDEPAVVPPGLRPAEEVLKSLLKGVSYAVVFGVPVGQRGVYLNAPASVSTRQTDGGMGPVQVPGMATVGSGAEPATPASKLTFPVTGGQTLAMADTRDGDKAGTRQSANQVKAAGQTTGGPGPAGNGKTASSNADPPGSGDSDGLNGHDAQNLGPEEREMEIADLHAQIEGLENRIASGASDMAYELWTQHKDFRYIKHEKETLEELQAKLATLVHGY
jgi:hypothetical protein